MKKLFTLLTALTFGASAYAGPDYSPTLVPAPTTQSCFNGSELQLDGFAVASFLDASTEWGGGAGINYFTTPYFGLGGDIYWAKIGDSLEHNLSASAILRLPLEDFCSAIYGFGGGGLHTDNENIGTIHVGVGFEWRPVGPDGIGLFTDLRYTWADEDKGVEDAPHLRVGVRAIF